MTLWKPDSTRFWHYDFEINGDRYRGSTKRTTEREARIVENAERTKILNRDQLGHRDEISLGDAVQRWLDEESAHKRNHYGDQCVARKLFGEERDRDTGKIEKTRWGLPRSLLLSAIDTPKLNEVIVERRKEGLKDATIMREIALLQRVRSTAQSEWKKAVHPDFNVKGIRKKKLKETAKLRFLSDAEQEKLLGYLHPTCPDRRYFPSHNERTVEQRRWIQDGYDLCVALLDTGARLGEITSLPWDVIDFKRNRLDLYRWKTGREGFVPLSKRLRAVMERRYADRSGPYVFPGKDGGGPRKARAQSIGKAMDHLGFNPEETVRRKGRATIHTLRDTFAARLAQSGKVQLYDIQKLLGHTTPAMTQKYAHLIPDVVAERALAVLDAA